MGCARRGGERGRRVHRRGSQAAVTPLTSFPLTISLLGPPPACLHACADNIALGTACGKMFRCGILSVTDVGDSDIVRSTIPEA